MRPRKPRGRLLVGLAAIGLAMGANASVLAQTAPPVDILDQFGGYRLEASGRGFSIAYDSPGLIPGTPSPIFQISLPEAQAKASNGPQGYALAATAYPGALLADLGSVIAQGGYDVPVPPYPLRTQAFYPAGPTEEAQEVGTASMHSLTTDLLSDAVARYGGGDLPGFLQAGAITVHTNSALEQGQTVSRTQVEITGLRLLFGLIGIESIVTDLVANSNGETSASDGTTVLTGVSFLGLPAVLDGNGFRLVGEPESSPDPGNPLGGLVDGLGPVGEALTPVADGLSQLVSSVLGAQGTVNELIAQSGISIRVLDPIETKDPKNPAQVSRLGNGVLIELRYDGETAPVLSQLLALIPSDDLPNDSIPGFPLNTSPQALVNLMKETHIETIGLASAFVSAVASPAFVSTPIARPPTSTGGGAVPTGGSTTGGASTGGGGFRTPAPVLGAPSTPAGGPALTDVLPISAAAGTIPVAAAIVLLLITAWGAGVGSGKLADNTLAAVSSSCPDGLDARRPRGGP